MALSNNSESVSVMDDVEKNVYKSFGEVAALAVDLLRDWPKELEGQHELRRLAGDIAVHLPTCPEATAAAGEKILLNVSESWLNEPLTITERINPGAPVPRPLLMERDNGAPVPIEQTFAHASNQMPLNRRKLYEHGAAYEDEPFVLRFDSHSTKAKVIGHPEIISFEPAVPRGAPPIADQHLIHDVNGDILSVRGKLTEEDREAILSGEWTIMPSSSDLLPQPLPSRAVPRTRGFNPVVFRALADDNPTATAPTEDTEAPILSPTSNGSAVLRATPSSPTPLSTLRNSAVPAPSPLSDDCAEEQEAKRPPPNLPLEQPVVLVQAAPPSVPSDSVSPSSHSIANLSSGASTDDRRSLKRTSTFDVDPSSFTSDSPNLKTPICGPTSLGPRKRELISDSGPGSDDMDDKFPKRQRGIDGQPRQPPATIPGSPDGGSPSQGQSGADSGNRQSSPQRKAPKPMLPYNAKTGRKLRREGAYIERDFGKYTAWLPNPHPHAYSDDPAPASVRPLKRTDTVTSDDPAPTSVRPLERTDTVTPDDPAPTSVRPLKRTGAVIGLNVGRRVEWLPRPPPSGFYGRYYLTASTSTTPVNPSSSGVSFGQGSNPSDNILHPPATHNAILPPAIPEGFNIDDLGLEYVDDPSLPPPPIAATTDLSGPSTSWVPPPMPETPTPASRTRRRDGAIGERAAAASTDTRKRSRDDDEDEDESLRPTSRIRSSSVPLPVPSLRLPILRLPPPRIPLAATSSSSSAPLQTGTTNIVQASPEAPPLRRSSRLARAGNKVRK